MDGVLVGVAIAITAVLVGIAAAKRARAAFEERFPPISDAEFLSPTRSSGPVPSGDQPGGGTGANRRGG